MSGVYGLFVAVWSLAAAAFVFADRSQAAVVFALLAVAYAILAHRDYP